MKIGTITATFYLRRKLKFAHILLRFVSDLIKFGTGRIHKISVSRSVVVSCVKFGPVTAIFSLGSQVNVQPYFQYLLSDFAANWLRDLYITLCRTGKFLEKLECHTFLITTVPSYLCHSESI